MPFILLLASVLVMGIVLTIIDRHSLRGKQLLTFFYVAVAVLMLFRANFVGAVLFGIFALWQWNSVQRLQGRGPAMWGSTVFGSGQQRAKTPDGRSKLPSGCPPKCTEHDLTGLDLQAVSLKGADLRGSNLFVADLRQADLSGANLAGVDLGGAKLHGADLRQANLDEADLRGAKYDDGTIWPTNFNPTRAGAVKSE